MKQHVRTSRLSLLDEWLDTPTRGAGGQRACHAPAWSRATVLLLVTSAGGLVAWMALSALIAGGVTPPGASFFTGAVASWRPGALTYASANPSYSMLTAGAAPLVCASSGESAVGADLDIPAGETICGDVLVTGGNLSVHGAIRGSAQIIGGSATIAGTVSGNVTAIGGNITLLAGANVAGSAHAIGGSVYIVPGATVTNSGSDLSEPADLARAPGLNFTVDAGSFWLSLLFWVSAALGLTTLAPEMVGRVRYTISRHAALSGLTGVGLALVALILMVVLFVTCIGIPIALLIALAAWAAWVTGTIGLSAWIGSVIFGGPRRAPSLMASSVLGVLVLSLLKELPVAGTLVGFLAGAIALGGATLTLLSARRFVYSRPR